MSPPVGNADLSPCGPLTAAAGAPNRARQGTLYVASIGEVVDPSLWLAYRELLAPEERERLSRIQTETGAKEFLLGRALIRCALGLRTATAPTAWKLVVAPRGKVSARSEAGPAPDFSLSHADGLVVLAIGELDGVGVDIENRARINQIAPSASKFLAPDEQSALLGHNGLGARPTFIEIWTLKEAYAKALGLGLSLPFETFAFELTAPGRISLRDAANPDCSAWRFWQFDLGQDFVGALALKGGAAPTEVQRMIPLRRLRAEPLRLLRLSH